MQQRATGCDRLRRWISSQLSPLDFGLLIAWSSFRRECQKCTGFVLGQCIDAFQCESSCTYEELRRKDWGLYRLMTRGLVQCELDDVKLRNTPGGV